MALSAVGIVAALAIRVDVEQRIFEDTERAAVDWIGAMNEPRPHPPVTASDVDLIQLVNSSGNVVSASRAAAGRPALSEYWPSSDDRIQHRIECAAEQCVMFTAVRPSPQEEQLLWGGESHIVYAGRTQPPILATHMLELLLGAGVLTGSVLFAGSAWILVGLALRPVEAIRRQIAQVTVTDLSMRIPEPSGRDAIALLARTANETLSRLQEAVDHQRHFASMVTHELRTPLTGLRAQLEEALLYSDVDPRLAVEDALSTLDRCQLIIDEMLALTRLRTSPHEPQRVDLTALVEEEAAQRDPKVPIHVHADETVEVCGNPVQLAEVVVNLLVNAQRHAHTCVDVSVAGADGQATVSVLDDGAGIDPADRERVFTPFVRLSAGRQRDPQGSGLGLAISRAIAQAHQGTLTVEDSPRGAKFVLRLPLASAERRPGGDRQEGRAPPRPV
ncbi:signal transduction histidine kinase [Nonomuraea polychroma]|uniref:histidine kinase n=1 Tax=Nonomuraea polychroma TaxID=46176 RepID=A0A438MAA7_9ACTN|nr:HAMP domain-containing sensor histidine kinase [Nonomuraea polychroma]RVX42650.1 signal transduction histidine kinase [Nonomuraea polychroma]